MISFRITRSAVKRAMVYHICSPSIHKAWDGTAVFEVSLALMGNSKPIWATHQGKMLSQKTKTSNRTSERQFRGSLSSPDFMVPHSLSSFEVAKTVKSCLKAVREREREINPRAKPAMYLEVNTSKTNPTAYLYFTTPPAMGIWEDCWSKYFNTSILRIFRIPHISINR